MYFLLILGRLYHFHRLLFTCGLGIVWFGSFWFGRLIKNFLHFRNLLLRLLLLWLGLILCMFYLLCIVGLLGILDLLDITDLICIVDLLCALDFLSLLYLPLVWLLRFSGNFINGSLINDCSYILSFAKKYFLVSLRRLHILHRL